MDCRLANRASARHRAYRLIILGSLGITGLFPKAVIAMYLCFFPVTVAMVQGLRSPQRLEMELLHTYATGKSRYLLVVTITGIAALSVSRISGGHCQRSGRHHGGGITHWRTGWFRRSPADGVVLRQHGADLVSLGDGFAAGVTAHGHGQSD